MRTHVVPLELVRLQGIRVVGIQDKNVKGELLVRIRHCLLIVGCRHHPPGVLPSVSNLLVPGIVETPPTIVVVAQSAYPRYITGIHGVENRVELVLCLEAQLRHWRCPASLLDATPIEVVADVEDIVRVARRRTLAHGLSDILLCHIVRPDDERAVMGREHDGPMIRRLDVGAVQHASPVADCENVVWALTVHEAHVRQPHAVEVRGVHRSL
mmetsp:Transcript_82446/g.214825  ORF Transcript_82446/g.214825 Transcript_82446/m.214825 type:complete len:212 (-) Transcript_82446:444-1079(-)